MKTHYPEGRIILTFTDNTKKILAMTKTQVQVINQLMYALNIKEWTMPDYDEKQTNMITFGKRHNV